MTLPSVVITHWVHPQVTAMFDGVATVVCNDSMQSWPRETLAEHCRHASAIMTFMPDSVDAGFLSACPQLRIIAAALKGYDNFDVDACSERGVWFSIVPDLLTVPTAELTVGLMIAAGRHLRAGDALVRSGEFQGWRPVLYGTGLANRTAGLIGFGAVGRAINSRLRAFDMHCVFHDPRFEEGSIVDGARCVSLSTLLRSADYLIPMVPLNKDTLHLINASALDQCKPGAILINTGRGSAVDEQAVLAALESGHLGAYGADVFEMEDWARPDRPRHIDPALLAHPRTIFTPHLGSAVDEIRRHIAQAAARNILDVLDGRPPRDAINRITGGVTCEDAAP